LLDLETTSGFWVAPSLLERLLAEESGINDHVEIVECLIDLPTGSAWDSVKIKLIIIIIL
jgi:hypothetical protein